MVVVRGGVGHGAIAFAAAHADVESMAFLIRYSSGFVCVALPPARCDELDLPPMYPSRRGGNGSAFCVTVDARSGTTTGISAVDRALTVRRLADPASVPSDFVRPGHVVPVATAALVRLAPVAVFGHLVSPAEPTQLATDDELGEFAAVHRLAMLDLNERTAA